MRIVLLGLANSTSARTRFAAMHRGLLRELEARGHEVFVLERNTAPASASDMRTRKAEFGQVGPYRSISELKRRYTRRIREADVVIVGPFLPEGTEVGNWVTRTAKGVTAFYDLDTTGTLEKFEHGDAEYLSRALVPKYDLYLSFNGGPVQRMQAEFQSPMARSLNGPPTDRAAQLERFVVEARSGQLMA